MSDRRPHCCRRSAAGPPNGVEIGTKVRFLSLPDSYPEHPSRVEIIETHFSWVFLTDACAYKLKKPVRGDRFDFRTVEARRRNALAEWRLNRRLAGDVYLGIVPLTLSIGGRLAIGGCGTPVDWLVKMVRLRAERMFDRRLAARQWHRSDIEPIAWRLAAFFATARRTPIAAPQLSAQIRVEIADTLKTISALAPARFLSVAKPLARGLEAFLARRAGLFRQRIRDRRLVDGHGDLRPEHIYVNGTPRVIDCLEFRDDLRRLDPLSEIAYLALECRRLGGVNLGGRLLRRYRERTCDSAPEELVHFYAALNAIVRARIAILHLAEPGRRTSQELVSRAGEYLALAEKESRFLAR